MPDIVDGNPPPGHRRWVCPDCKATVFLPQTKLDPLRCEACAQRKAAGGKVAASSTTSKQGAATALTAIPGWMWGAAGLCVGAFGGLVLGVVIGRLTAPAAAPSIPAKPGLVHPLPPDDSRDDRPPPTTTQRSDADDGEDPSDAPKSKPGYTWVKPTIHPQTGEVTRKGYWRKRPGSSGE